MEFQEDIGDLQRRINVFKLQRINFTEAQLTVELETSRASAYFESYLDGLKLGTNLPSTELQPSDDLVILSAQALISIWKISKESTYLHKAASILEFGLVKSQQSFQIRLLLIRIYRLLCPLKLDIPLCCLLTSV